MQSQTHHETYEIFGDENWFTECSKRQWSLALYLMWHWHLWMVDEIHQ